MFQILFQQRLKSFFLLYTQFNIMLSERSIFSLCEVLPNTTLQVRLADQIVDGEAVKASTFRRYCLVPGSDITGQPPEVVKIANALWTPESIAAYNASIQPIAQ